MCLFLSWDFEYRLQCPVDKIPRTVRVQSYPHLRGHFLDVVGCDAVADIEKLPCRKACRDALENGDFWRGVGGGFERVNSRAEEALQKSAVHD